MHSLNDPAGGSSVFSEAVLLFFFRDGLFTQKSNLHTAKTGVGGGEMPFALLCHPNYFEAVIVT